MPSPPPSPRTRLVGRDADVADVLRLLDASRLVTVKGPGGVGKTRLALAVGAALVEAGAEVVWVELDCVSDARALARAVATALGAAVGDDPAASVGWALAGRPAPVLLLDNFEQVVDAAPETLGRWLAGHPGLRAVATSRASLRLDGEVLHELAPLPLPAPGAAPDEAIHTDAVRLFLDRATAARPGYRPDPPELEAIAALVRGLDGLPLAIELAAARIRASTARHLLAGIADRFRWLGGARRDVTARQGTLEGAIAWSWDLLDDAERRTLAWLSVFAGGFTLEAAEWVLGGDAHAGGADALDVVEALVDQSLVTVTDEGALRYRTLDSIRAFAAARLEATGDAPEAARAHARWYARYGEQAYGDSLDSPGGRERWEELARERENLVAAVTRLDLHGDAEAAAHAFIAFFNVLLLYGPMPDGPPLAAALLHHPGLSPRTRVRLDRVVGDLLMLSGRVEESWRILDDAEPLTRQVGDPVLVARLALSTAIWYQERGEPSAALPLLDRALATPGLRAREAALLYGARATSRYALDDLHAAVADNRRALALHREVGNTRLESMALTNLGLLELDHGRPDAALALFREALPMTLALHNRRQEADVHRCIGATLLEAPCPTAERPERLAQAERHLREAVAIHQSVGLRRMEGVARATLAGVLARTDPVAAEAEALTAVRLAREVGHRRNEIVALGRVGEALLRQGRTRAAYATFDEAQAATVGTTWRAEATLLWVLRGEAELALGEDAEARMCLARAEATIDPDRPDGEGVQAVQRLRAAFEG